jgi:hypothetical protein
LRAHCISGTWIRVKPLSVPEIPPPAHYGTVVVAGLMYHTPKYSLHIIFACTEVVPYRGAYIHTLYDRRGITGYNLGDPPSLNSEFTTGFPTSKYMYKLGFTLSGTFALPLHEAMFTPTAHCRRAGTHTLCNGAVRRLRPWPSAAIWRACGATLGPNHEARCHGRPARGQRSIIRPDLRRRRAP